MDRSRSVLVVRLDHPDLVREPRVADFPKNLIGVRLLGHVALEGGASTQHRVKNYFSVDKAFCELLKSLGPALRPSGTLGGGGATLSSVADQCVADHLA